MSAAWRRGSRLWSFCFVRDLTGQIRRHRYRLFLIGHTNVVILATAVTVRTFGGRIALLAADGDLSAAAAVYAFAGRGRAPHIAAQFSGAGMQFQRYA